MSIDVTIRISDADGAPLSDFEKGILQSLSGSAPAAAAAPQNIVVNVADNSDTGAEQPAPAPAEDPTPTVKKTRAPRAKKAAEPAPEKSPEPESGLGVFEDLGDAPAAAAEPEPEAAPEAPAEETAPEPEPAVVEADQDAASKERAIEVATEMMGNGKSAEIKKALAVAGAARVGLLEGDQIAKFLAAVEG